MYVLSRVRLESLSCIWLGGACWGARGPLFIIFIGGPTGPPMAFMAFMLGMPAMLFMVGCWLQTTVCAARLSGGVGWSLEFRRGGCAMVAPRGSRDSDGV